MPRRSPPPQDVRARLARLAALGSLAAALFPQTAAAQEFTGGGSVYASFTFGDGWYGVGWGVEGIFSMVLEGGDSSCSGDGVAGVGVTTQIGAIDLDTFRLVGAVHGGGSAGEASEAPVLAGELGVAMHAHEEGVDAGIHTGFVVDVPFTPISAWSNFVRAEWLLDEYSVGGGFILPGRYGLSQQICVIEGRPLRDARGGLSDAPSVDARSLDGAARAWAENAQAEASSVPAFLVLAEELLRARAPLHLVDAALDAAADEIRHARACARVASTLAGRPVRPVVPAAHARPALDAKSELTRLGVESWVDGCLNEGSAARRAALAARGTDDARIASTLRGIARDEARHAALGWDILAFAVASGGDSVRDAVRGLREERVTFAREHDAGDARRGLLARADAEAANALVAERARARLDALL